MSPKSVNSPILTGVSIVFENIQSAAIIKKNTLGFNFDISSQTLNGLRKLM